MAAITIEDVRQAAAGLTGEIDQVPPMVSAVKVGGRRLYELAREGTEVERAPRPVVVHRFDVEPGPEKGVFAVRVECSSGTYVRTLAADLGSALGGGAHLRALRRTAIGPFTLEGATPLDSLGPPSVLAPLAAVAYLERVVVGADIAGEVGHGAVLDRRQLDATGEGPWAVVDDDGNLLAVYEARPDGTTKPSMVLAAR